jgi:hypothetical protein
MTEVQRGPRYWLGLKRNLRQKRMKSRWMRDELYEPHPKHLTNIKYI